MAAAVGVLAEEVQAEPGGGDYGLEIDVKDNIIEAWRKVVVGVSGVLFIKVYFFDDTSICKDWRR